MTPEKPVIVLAGLWELSWSKLLVCVIADDEDEPPVRDIVDEVKEASVPLPFLPFLSLLSSMVKSPITISICFGGIFF